jgi:Cdc6-like AAA superfamily ATPase
VSADLLNELLDGNAFLPSPLIEDLLSCYLPFEELVPGSTVESDLEERVRRGRAIALVGESGAGKSASMTYVLDRITTDFAPIRAPVFYEAESTVTSPADFTRYLLQRLLTEAQEVASIEVHQREELLQQASERLVTPTKTLGRHVGGSIELPWLLKGETARDVATTIAGADLKGSAAAALEAVDRVVEAIYGQGLTPVVVIDDTDRWLKIGDVDRSSLVGQFFGSIVRMLAERGCGLVVAVHATYLDLEEYVAGTRGFLTERVDIEPLTSASAFSAILQHRVNLVVPGATLQDTADDDVADRLFHYYQEAWRSSLRWALQAAHEALTTAATHDAAKISAALIDDAAASYPT